MAGKIENKNVKGFVGAYNSGEKMTRLLNIIFEICDLAGFSVENRIVLRDKKTGKVWK